MGKLEKVPDRIWLLANGRGPDDAGPGWEFATWWLERIDDGDIGYVRKGIAEKLWEYCEFLLGVAASRMGGSALYNEISALVDETEWLKAPGDKGVDRDGNERKAVGG